MVRLRALVGGLSLALAAAALVVSCGGTSVRHGGDDDGGEAGGEAGDGGSTSGRGGSSATTGGTGTGATGGSSATTGGTGTGATGGTAGSGGSGGCLLLPCAYPLCPDGVLIEPECGCATCDCSAVTCAALECPPERITREFGACCDSCAPPPSCDGAECRDNVNGCSENETWLRKPGACCSSCVPDGPTGCLEIACSDRLYCQPGYVRGDLAGGCCYECLPDPRYCEADTDCMIANRPRGCCECSEAISLRMFEEDACWFDPRAPRTVPSECQPDRCDAACEPCGIPEQARCEEHHCVVAE